jgi:hypothetical protein
VRGEHHRRQTAGQRPDDVLQAVGDRFEAAVRQGGAQLLGEAAQYR